MELQLRKLKRSGSCANTQHDKPLPVEPTERRIDTCYKEHPRAVSDPGGRSQRLPKRLCHNAIGSRIRVASTAIANGLAMMCIQSGNWNEKHGRPALPKG
jgi:hypothetical protein